MKYKIMYAHISIPTYIYVCTCIHVYKELSDWSFFNNKNKC